VAAQTNLQLIGELVRSGWNAADLKRIDASYSLATRSLGHLFRPDGRPFVAHLCGTASLVAREGASPDTIVAALLHAIFAQGHMARNGGASAANKRAVADVAGTRAVEIILAYDALPWKSEPILKLANSGTPPVGLQREALLIRLANEADDNVDGAAALSSKQRYAGRPDLLEAVDKLAGLLEAPGLAVALRTGLAQADQLNLPASFSARPAASFAGAPPKHGLRHAIDRIRRAVQV
jgi:hypothetical protein